MIATVYFDQENFEQVPNVVTWEIHGEVIVFYTKQSPESEHSNQNILAYREYFCFLLEEE